LGEHFGVEVGANPEARHLDQLIQHRSRGINQSRTLGLRDHPQQTRDGQPSGLGRPSPAPFVDEQQVSPAFDRKHNRFGLTQI
jgi:hypothetical protein